MTDLEYIKAWLKDDYALENTLSDRDIEVLESVAKKLEELPLRRKEAKRFRMKYINYRSMYEKEQAKIDKIKADIENARYGLINDGLDVALDIIDKHTKGGAECRLYENTKREQGEWLKHESLMEYECICSKCNKDVLSFIGVDNTEMAYVAKDMNYCPNCGAEMKGGAE